MKLYPLALVALVSLQHPLAFATGTSGEAAFASGDYPAAFRAWQQSAVAGDPRAMAAIGMLYDTGHGVPQDFGLALAWYRQAAEAGNVRAMFNVGAMYDSGRGTPADRRTAIRWYTMAAKRGNGRAAYNLAMIYRDGDGVPRDTKASVRFFRLAASAGVEAARTNLATLGQQVASRATPAPAQPPSLPPNVQQVTTQKISSFQKIALARASTGPADAEALSAVVPGLLVEAAIGNRLAQYDVGFAYEHGVGVPVDLAKAYAYYLRASGSGAKDISAAALEGARDVQGRLAVMQHR